jgi:P4 family phage/plasmid primase-like protien
MTRERIGFDELLYGVLGFDDRGDHVSIGVLDPATDIWRSVVVLAYGAPGFASICEDTAVYFSANPVGEIGRGRGKREDVTRLASVFADLDFKESGCGSLENALTVIESVSELIGMQPSAVVYTGGGLHPYWPISDGHIKTAAERKRAMLVLARFGKLVRQQAEALGGKVDSVFELARMLRVPGSQNFRYGDPIDVYAERFPGTPLTMASLEERLDAAGITSEVEALPATAVGSFSQVVSVPSDWDFADEQCQYAVRTLQGWKGDTPERGRHPWLVSQMIRLVAMHRRGCLTRDGYVSGYATIEARFAELCSFGIGGDERKVAPREVSDSLGYAIPRVAAMSEEDLDRELGEHLHDFEMLAGVMVAPLVNSDPVPNQPPPVDTEDRDDDFTSLVGADSSEAPAHSPESGRAITMTDSGAADLLVFQHQHALRFCPEMGKWLTFDGITWIPRADDSAAFQAARITVESLPADGPGPLAAFKKKCLAAAKLGAMVGLARRDRDLQVSIDSLDSDPYLLNTRSGVVDVRSGSLISGRGEVMHTLCTGVGYDPVGTTPRWDAFLAETFGGDAEMVAYIRRLAGLSALGEVREHVLPFLHGAGANGKTVLLDVLQGILGDYAIVAPQNFLTAGRDKHETEIARLRGARLVVASEISPGSRFDEAKIKVLTGGDSLTGRFMRGDFFDFVPSHTVWLAGNHQPTVDAGGYSFWRRLRLIPFSFTVPEHRRIKGLDKLLIAEEGDAILAWIVQGAVDVLRFGLVDPPSVLAATEEYMRQEDHLARFADECLILDLGEGDRVTNAALNACYRRWCSDYNEDELPERQFGREMTARFNLGMAKGTGGVRMRSHVAIRSEASPSWLMDGRS